MARSTQFPARLAAILVFLAPPSDGGARVVTRFDSATDWERFPQLFKPAKVVPRRVLTVRPDGVYCDFRPLKSSRDVGMRAVFTLTGNVEIAVK